MRNTYKWTEIWVAYVTTTASDDGCNNAENKNTEPINAEKRLTEMKKAEKKFEKKTL